MLLDEGFQKYKQVSPRCSTWMSPLSIEVDKGMESSLRLKTAHPLRVILKENERMKISHHFFLRTVIIAPCEEGQKLGDLEYRLGSVLWARSL